MKVQVTVADEEGVVLATILGITNDEVECDRCDHDSHFSIESVRQDRGLARDALVNDILAYVPRHLVELLPAQEPER